MVVHGSLREATGGGIGYWESKYWKSCSISATRASICSRVGEIVMCGSWTGGKMDEEASNVGLIGSDGDGGRRQGTDGGNCWQEI